MYNKFVKALENGKNIKYSEILKQQIRIQITILTYNNLCDRQLIIVLS